MGKRKRDDLPMDECAEEACSEVEEACSEVEEAEKPSGKCLVMIIDQFVKFEGKVYPRHTKLEICKELAKTAKRCKVL